MSPLESDVVTVTNNAIRFGYTSKQSALLNVPSGLIQACAVLLAAWVSGRTNNRGLGIVALLLPGILGGGLMAFLPAGNKFKGGKLAGIYLAGIFGPSTFLNALDSLHLSL